MAVKIAVGIAMISSHCTYVRFSARVVTHPAFFNLSCSI